MVLSPITAMTEKFLGRFLDAVADEDHPGNRVSNEEIKLVIEQSHEHGVVSMAVHDRLVEVVDLSETLVKETVTHRTDIGSVQQDCTREDCIEALRQKSASVILVNDEDDNCVGILTPQDLLRTGRPQKRFRKPLVYSRQCPPFQIIQLFQAQQNHRRGG